MEREFWLERWEKNQLGWHLSDTNPLLAEHWGSLDVTRGAGVFVPLCGKSLDMLWLARQGFRVTGVEISRRAVEDFFAENRLAYTAASNPAGQRFDSGGLTIFRADFFTVDLGDLPPVEAVYDRASLVALPPDMRPGYARRLAALTPAGARVLLISLDYPQQQMAGPPFAVSPTEVRSLFAGSFRVEALHSEDCLESEPRFREKGLTQLSERVFLLERGTIDERVFGQAG